MKIKDIVARLKATERNICECEKEITGGYAGDFLSFVMGKAPSDCAWFTVMNNANVAAVALLAEIGIIICCEGVKADEKLVERAKNEELNLIETDLDVYNAILEFAKQ